MIEFLGWVALLVIFFIAIFVMLSFLCDDKTSVDRLTKR